MPNDLLQNPAVQAGLAPLFVALVIGFVLRNTRAAWVAIIVGYATFVALTTGFQLEPLTASRKVLLIILAAPVAGLLIDALDGRRALAVLAAVGAAAASVWAYQSVLQQKDANAAMLAGGGVALFVVVLVALMLRLRGDGLRTGAAGVGLGLAAGVSAMLSASIGGFMAGITLAAASGAMLLVQIARREPIAPGALGALSIAVPAAFVSASTFNLESLPWYAMPAMLLVPAAVLWPSASEGGVLRRSFVLGVYALVAATLPIAAAWLATRSG